MKDQGRVISFENLSRVDGTARFAFGEQDATSCGQRLTIACDRQNRRTCLRLGAHRGPLGCRKSISGHVRRPPATSCWRASDGCTRPGLVHPIGAPPLADPDTPPAHPHPARTADSFSPDVFSFILATADTGTESACWNQLKPRARSSIREREHACAAQCRFCTDARNSRRRVRWSLSYRRTYHQSRPRSTH